MFRQSEKDLINFVEEETVLMNDSLFSREALHEYIKHPERSTHLKARKLKNCYTKADQKTVEETVTVASIKCKFCDGNHNLDDCQFYCEITVDDRSSFLKKNRLLWLLCRNLIKTYSTILCKQKSL